MFLKYAGIYLLETLTLKVQRVDMVKGSGNQDSGQSEMRWEVKRESLSIYDAQMIGELD